MKNANVFVDVDLTLVDARGRLLDGAAQALRELRAAGCHLFLWSSAGPEYARTTAQRHGVADLFEGFAAKPDILIDDMPATAQAPFVYSVGEACTWSACSRDILNRHIDRSV